MILDSIKNAELYYSLSPSIKKAFDWLANTDIKSLSTGRHDIDGDNLFVNVMDVELKPRHEAALEVHNRYVDIQIMCGGKEEYGWAERCNCHAPREEFNNEKDVQFFTDIPQCFYTVAKGQFSILFPEDGHAPMLGEGHVKKCIFKVAL